MTWLVERKTLANDSIDLSHLSRPMLKFLRKRLVEAASIKFKIVESCPLTALSPELYGYSSFYSVA